MLSKFSKNTLKAGENYEKDYFTFLALLMLFSLLTLTLTSCDKEEEQTKAKGDSGSKAEEEYIEGDIFSERAQVDDELGDYDFGGKSLRFVSYGAGRIVPKNEKNSGNLISDAL